MVVHSQASYHSTKSVWEIDITNDLVGHVSRQMKRFCMSIGASSPYHSSNISTELLDTYPNDFGDVRTGRPNQQAILLAFYFQFRVDHDNPAERFNGFHSKAGAALRRIGVPGPEAPAQ